MLEPKWDLPPGVYVDTDRDARTVDVLNRSDAAVVAHVADVMRSFGVTVGAEEGTVRLASGSGSRSTAAAVTATPSPVASSAAATNDAVWDSFLHSFFTALGGAIVLGVVSLIAAGFGLIPGLRQRIDSHDVKLPRWVAPVVAVLAFLAVMTLPILLTTCK